ncbi:MAG: hypothetical protein PHD13_02375 [Methanocellales archaeon]|nr:hypothetical protein [Methanocellales archaeon]MDD3291120.1 hypothetical protein [Methanocellales archaeon]MDD5235005.1 hypothetical protein [Methanocellales archaeon]MDD5484624.1 hypothetical protein [Methanocellales archaeon]
MPDEETSYEVLAKNRAIKITFGNIKMLAVNLPGTQVLGLDAILKTIPVELEIAGKKGIENNWIVLMKDSKGITKPYDVWAKDVATVISEASENDVSNLSIAVSPPDYETLMVDSEADLKKAYADNWSEPYQYKNGKWILRRLK